MNHEKINEALEVLRVEGLKHFDEGADVNKYEAIGAALAQVEDGPFAAGRLAHEYWEEHNLHDLATLLRWAFDYYLTEGGPVSMQEAQWVKRLVDTESISLYGADGTPKRYRVNVVIQEILNMMRAARRLVTGKEYYRMNTKSNQPAQIADPYRPVVLAFLREYFDHEILKLREHFGIELDPADLPTSDDDYLRLPIAESCQQFALVAAGQTRGIKQRETRAHVQRLLDNLFSVPGTSTYEMPATFWLSDFGNMVLLAMVWAMDIELITVTQAMELTGRTYDFFTHTVQRGRLTTYPDNREPNPQRRSRLDKAQVLALLGKK